MFNQYKSYLWTFLRHTVLGILLKSITGPYGFIIRRLIPVIADKILKPIYDKVAQKIIKAYRKKEAKIKIKEIDDAETADDYLNTLNK